MNKIKEEFLKVGKDLHGAIGELQEYRSIFTSWSTNSEEAAITPEHQKSLKGLRDKINYLEKKLEKLEKLISDTN